MLFILEKYFPQKVEIYTYIKLLFSSLSANPVDSKVNVTVAVNFLSHKVI